MQSDLVLNASGSSDQSSIFDLLRAATRDCFNLQFLESL